MKHKVFWKFLLIWLMGLSLVAVSGYAQDHSADIQKNLELLKSKQDYDRQEAARILGIIGNNTAVDGLISALKDPDLEVREEAARSLGMLKNPKATDPLLNAYQHDSRTVGMAALEGLREIGDKRAVGPLMKELRLGAEPYVEDTISDTIREIVGYLPSPDETSWEREYALERLASGDPQEKASALYDLGEIRDFKALEAIQAALAHENPNVRAIAADALSKMPDPSSEPALISLLNDPDYVIRTKVKNALEAIDSETARQAIAQAEKQGAFNPPDILKPGGLTSQTSPVTADTPQGLHQWGSYDLSDNKKTTAEHLSPGTYTLFKALDEIQQMLAEVDAQIAKHTRIYEKPTFLACYYVKKGGLPESELGVSALKINAKGHITDFPEWLNHEMANISDIPFGGPYIPGMSSNKYTCLRYSQMRGHLKEALKYFKKYSDFYTQHPPIDEMQHLRATMAQWRSIVVAYHTALDAYLTNLSQWIVIKKYYGGAVYDQKKQAIEAKYPLRGEDDLQATKYDIEIKAFEKWWAGLKQKMQTYYDLFNQKEADIWATQKIELPKGLEAQFGPHVRLMILNNKYKEKTAQLKTLDKNSDAARTLSEEIKTLEKEINPAIQLQTDYYGKTWKDRFRDDKGKLPGGLIKDGWFDKIKQMAGKGKKENQAQTTADLKSDPGKDPFYEFLKKSLTEKTQNTKAAPGSVAPQKLTGSRLNSAQEYMEDPSRTPQANPSGAGVIHGMEAPKP